MNTPPLGVLAGYDGSPGSETALAWAARAAEAAGTTLFVVTAVPYGSRGDDKKSQALYKAARATLDAAVARIHVVHPHLTVETSLREGPAADVILEASGHADLVVVGSRGHGGFIGLIIGSVSLRVSSHSTCPVIVVPTEVEDHADVVVGVDDATDLPAVEFAVAQARRTGGRVVAVHAWTMPMYGAAMAMPLVADTRELADSEHQVLDGALKELRSRTTDVDIVSAVTVGSPAYSLLGPAQDAALLVVAAHRGRGLFPLRLGPTTHAVLHHQKCPVAVVPVHRAAH
jgi:nucleotide-binding universal stress UspA family protein